MSKDDKLKQAYALETKDDVRALYRGWATTYDTEFAEAGGFRLPGLVATAFQRMGGTGPVLDAGCGTGLVAASLPPGIEVDGIDLSPDMLAVAGQRDRYRALIEADLTSALPFEDGTYRGLVSSGTFTHGHVGPEALQELLRCLTSGAIAALSTNATYMEKTGFRDSLVTLAASGRIGDLELSEERIYADPDGAPEGHGEDMGFIVTFRRL